MVLILCCKSGLQKQGLKHCMPIINEVHPIPSVAKVVYENKDWNIALSALGFNVVLKVAKVVYENKDWNSSGSCFGFNSDTIRLQKSSTKTMIETIIRVFIRPVFFSVAKVVYQNKDWNVFPNANTCMSLHTRCKSRLPKQGLKLLTDIVVCHYLVTLQKSSTKTRIETISYTQQS